MTLRVQRALDLTKDLVHHLRQVVRSQGWDSRSSRRSRDTRRSPSLQGGQVREDVVDPIKMLTLSVTIALLSILKIRAAVVEVTQVTISLVEPVLQILHLVRQDSFLLSDMAFSSHRRFKGLHGAAQ
jgi:hypothetical protein